MGSEMCIRDRHVHRERHQQHDEPHARLEHRVAVEHDGDEADGELAREDDAGPPAVLGLVPVVDLVPPVVEVVLLALVAALRQPQPHVLLIALDARAVLGARHDTEYERGHQQPEHDEAQQRVRLEPPLEPPLEPLVLASSVDDGGDDANLGYGATRY